MLSEGEGMGKVKGFFQRKYEQVFTSKRMTFMERLRMVIPRVPLNIADLLVTVVIFKYFTDVIGLQPLMVGTIFMVLGIWNAVNDPIIGILLDRMPYSEKRGKYIYVAKIMVPVISLSMLGLILVNNSWPSKLIYMYLIIMFIIYEAGVTAYSTGLGSYVFLRLRDTQERMEYSVILTYFTYILSALITLIPLFMFVGDQPTDYITPVLVCIITLNALLGWFGLSKLKDKKEYYQSDFINSDAQLAKDLVRYTKDIVKSKGFWYSNALTYLFRMSVAYYFTFYLYYVDNIVFATSLQSVVIDTCNGLIMFIVIPLIPSIYRKYGIKKAYGIIIIPAMIGFITLFFANSIWTVFFAFALIVMTHGSQMTIQGPTTSLVIDEDWQKTGQRKIGYINALSGLVNKPADGIRAFIFGAVLTYYGYDGAVKVQTDRAVEGLRFASSVIPLIALTLAFVVVMLLPYSKPVEDEIIRKRKEMEEGGTITSNIDKENELYDFANGAD